MFIIDFGLGLDLGFNIQKHIWYGSGYTCIQTHLANNPSWIFNKETWDAKALVVIRSLQELYYNEGNFFFFLFNIALFLSIFYRLRKIKDLILLFASIFYLWKWLNTPDKYLKSNPNPTKIVSV